MAYMEVNYLAEIIAFERWLETNYLPISSQLLWYKMMNLFNRSGWSEWVIVDNLRLMAAMQMSREATLIKARDDLIKAGLIVYQKGRKGSPNRYKMVYFTFKSVVQSEVKGVVESVVQSEVKGVVESVDIYKHKQKQNMKKDTNVSKKFVPPTVEEVRRYCQERENNINPEEFVDFYKSKGWMVGKNHMKDWKAAVRTWEQNDKKRNQVAKATDRNSFRNFDQRDTNYNDMVMDQVKEWIQGNDEV